MTKKTDAVIEKRICSLKRNGLKTDEIVVETGVKKGTVRDILRRNGLTGSTPKKTPDTQHETPDSQSSDESRTPAHDREDESNTQHPTPNTINPNLTKANTSHEIIQYVQFFRRRTKDVPYKSLSDHDMVWAETNYGKRWADGVKMMIDATGLSAEAIQQVVDDYEKDVTEALERFNEKYNKEHEE